MAKCRMAAGLLLALLALVAQTMLVGARIEIPSCPARSVGEGLLGERALAAAVATSEGLGDEHPPSMPLLLVCSCVAQCRKTCQSWNDTQCSDKPWEYMEVRRPCPALPRHATPHTTVLAAQSPPP